MLEQALNLIEAQQQSLQGSPAFFVGEQLKDMLRAEPVHAQLVAQDLAVPGMGLADVEKKIAAAAQKNKKGNMGFCSPRRRNRSFGHFTGCPWSGRSRDNRRRGT